MVATMPRQSAGSAPARFAPEAVMLQFLRSAFCMLARLVLSLRYRIRVDGLEQVRSIQGPTVVLPNHPAYIDPAIVLTVLWPSLRMRPLVFEGMFGNPLLFPFFKLVDALPVPDLERASSQAKEQTGQVITRVVEGLRGGRNFILWPAGRIQRGGGVEILGGTRALADILQAVPELSIVRVRTRGLWGSSFSYARTGTTPKITRAMFAGAGWLLANLFFFMPRRPVEMVVERVDRDQLPELRREKLNPWFEAWYNEGGPEPPTFVPHHFAFGARTYDFPRPPAGLAEADLSRVKPETKAAVAQILAEKLHRPLDPAEEQPGTTMDQLGLDSLDRMEMTLRIEREFGFSADQSPANVGQLWALAQGLIERAAPKPAPPEWFPAAVNSGTPEVLGATVPEAFVNRALKDRRNVVAADDLSGALSYERLLVGALTMSRRFAPLPSANVGLMLPASVASDAAFLGLHLAGKLPVMLNWTTGPANLAHAARTMQLSHVVTSRAFVDRAAVEVAGTQYLFVEDLRKDIGKIELLRTLLTVRYRPGHVRGLVPAIDPGRPAVVLFTSGSERAPKAVPLTHDNLLSNIRSGVPIIGLQRTDSIVGFLPAFHSFGLTVTMLMPLLTGTRVVHHPDPTDSSGLTRKVAAYQATLLVGTPTFVSFILDRARPGQLDSLRRIICGAEKCPPALFERCKQLAPGAALVEGYGITECSPVVAVNRLPDNRPGTLGRPLPGIDLLVVDVDTEETLPTGTMGMLWVAGPTVFPGYIGHDGPSPFRERDGKRWYVTGDLATVDADGFIHFGGRLKRFLKAGGEMISLPALEEPFTQRFPPTDKGPAVAVEGMEDDHGRLIVLFSTAPLQVSEANAWLRESGFHGVMKIDEVRQVETIPVLGTGKTDYKVLRELIARSRAAGT